MLLQSILAQVAEERFCSEADSFIKRELCKVGEEIFEPATVSPNACARCEYRETPQWRYIHKYKFCNACYMKVKRWYDFYLPGSRLPSRIKDPTAVDLECDMILYKAFNA